ncbi:MAG: pyridoxamine 5'-phosphate oxidase [Pseudomonadota bacterium]
MIAKNPFEVIKTWLEEAEKNEINDPNAMALATVDERGQPSLRMVLLKGFSQEGFIFYTNLNSRKGRELKNNPNAALLLHWKSLRRQIRVEGQVTPVTDQEADLYFATRPRTSRIGAWASQQSNPMKNRYELELNLAKMTAKYAVGEIPRPPYWSGFCLIPKRIELWQDQKFRLHDRFQFDREENHHSWKAVRLYP